MFIHIVTTMPDVLFSFLDPRHLGNLQLVNRSMAECITKSVQDQSVKDALKKYKRMVVIAGNTVRIHSSLGKTAIELILPNGDGVMAIPNAGYSMRAEGRLYRGWVDERCMVDNESKKVDLAPYVFFRNSPKLFNAESVYIMASNTYIMFDGLRTSIRVRIQSEGRDYVFTFFFRSHGW